MAVSLLLETALVPAAQAAPWSRPSAAETFVELRGAECGIGLTPKGEILVGGLPPSGPDADRLRDALGEHSVEGIERSLAGLLPRPLRQDPSYWEEHPGRLTARGCRAAVDGTLTRFPQPRHHWPGAKLLAGIKHFAFDGHDFDGSHRWGADASEVPAYATPPLAPAPTLDPRVRRAPPPPPPPAPHRVRAVLARTAGAGVAGAGIAGLGWMIYGPAAAAYFGLGSVLKSIGYSSSLLPRPLRRPTRWLGDHPFGVRMATAVGLAALGFATANPVAVYFGMSFGILGAGELAAKAAYGVTSRVLESPPVRHIGGALDRLLGRVVHVGPPASNAHWPARLARTAYAHRAGIAKAVVASGVSIGAVVLGAIQLDHALANTLGTMSTAPGSLSWQDRTRNTLIGAYRIYNPAGTVFRSGPQTRKFYAEMKAKYDPKTPQEWADVVDREVTWVYHGQLYSPVYHITSEEAAAVHVYKGVPGRYSDCTGKAALLQNLLKMDGYGESQIVIGLPSPDFWNMGHVWVVNPHSDTPNHELFHYDNTLDLAPVERVGPAHGLQGNSVGAFIDGGLGGVLGDIFYKLLDFTKPRARR